MYENKVPPLLRHRTRQLKSLLFLFHLGMDCLCPFDGVFGRLVGLGLGLPGMVVLGPGRAAIGTAGAGLMKGGLTIGDATSEAGISMGGMTTTDASVFAFAIAASIFSALSDRFSLIRCNNLDVFATRYAHGSQKK